MPGFLKTYPRSSTLPWSILHDKSNSGPEWTFRVRWPLILEAGWARTTGSLLGGELRREVPRSSRRRCLGSTLPMRRTRCPCSRRTSPTFQTKDLAEWLLKWATARCPLRVQESRHHQGKKRATKKCGKWLLPIKPPKRLLALWGKWRPLMQGDSNSNDGWGSK